MPHLKSTPQFWRFQALLLLAADEKIMEGAVPLSPLKPCRCGVRGLLITVAAILWETPRPEGRVDFRHNRFALRNLPSVERPEVNGTPAFLLEIQEPREAGMCRGSDLSLHSKTKNGLGGGSPLLGDPEPAAFPRSPYSLPCFGEPGSFDITPWMDRIQSIDASYTGKWELPVLGPVPASTAVLIRPDGYIAWAGEFAQRALEHALITWFGPGRIPASDD